MTADDEPRNHGHADRSRSDSNPHSTDSTSAEASLADRLTAIADHHSPTPSWSDVVERAEGAPVVPLHTTTRRPFAARSLAITAVLLVVLGATGIVIATRGNDGEQVVSGPGPDAGRDEVVDTGWYIPSPMPDGWQVTSIETSSMTLVGPGGLTIWAAPDGTRSISYASEPLGEGVPMAGTPIDLTDEITGTILDEGSLGYPDSIGWEHGDLFHIVVGNGISDDELVDAARQIATSPDQRTSPADDMDLIAHSVRSFDQRESTDVVISLRTAEGRPIQYSLSEPEGTGRASLLGTVPVVEEVDDQPLDVLRLTRRPGLDTSMVGYLGIWPGADVSLPLINYSYVLDGTQDHPTADEVGALIASLRPATAQEWRAFLEASGVEVDPSLLTAERFEDLSGEPDDGAADVEGPSTEPTQTPYVADEDWTGEASSSELTEVPSRWPEGGRGQLDDISDLEFTLTVERTDVVSGQAIGADLKVTNPTDELVEIHECTAISVAVGFVDPTSTDSLPLPMITDCYRTLSLSLPPGATVDWPLPFTEQLIDAREVIDNHVSYTAGGTLAPGRYLAAVDIPGSRGTVRVAVRVMVTPHPCGGVEGAFIDRYYPGSLNEARAQALADGMTLRVVKVDGVDEPITDDLHCDRVNVEVSSGRIMHVDVY